MKHKKIKMFISFLLALVLLVSLPLDIQANAAALEGWILYAVITYLAAMGITFTVAGGVDAMVQAMEEKVKDYETQNNIIDFYAHFRNNNVRLVPGGGSAPDGNPFFDLFFTASAVDAIDDFISWLTTEGGWLLGTNVNDGYSLTTFDAIYTSSDSTVSDTFTFVTSIIDSWEYSTDDKYSRAKILSLGTALPAKGSSITTVTTNSGNRSYIYYSTYNSQFEILNYSGDSLSFKTIVSPTKYNRLFSLETTADNILNNSEYAFVFSNGFLWGGFVYDGYFYLVGRASEYNGITSTISCDIDIPTEIPEIKPLPNQGVSIKDAIDVPMNDPSLDDWAQLVRDTFEDIGTIPQPVPQVVPDPDIVPPVTPAPSPEPSPEIEDIEDLGLPALGEAIKNKFPFCLPSDLRDLVSLLVAEPVTPKWEVDLYEWFDGSLAGDTTLGIDLAEYEVLGQISRWASVISFSIFLLLITKGMIGW